MGMGLPVCGRSHSHFLFEAGTEVILIRISHIAAYFLQGCIGGAKLLAGCINADICNNIGDVLLLCFLKKSA